MKSTHLEDLYTEILCKVPFWMQTNITEGPLRACHECQQLMLVVNSLESAVQSRFLEKLSSTTNGTVAA